MRFTVDEISRKKVVYSKIASRMDDRTCIISTSPTGPHSKLVTATAHPTLALFSLIQSALQ